MKKYILQNADELDNYMKIYDKILLQFSANWCGPCKRITPILMEVLNKVDDEGAIYIYCDVDMVEKLVNKFNINAVIHML